MASIDNQPLKQKLKVVVTSIMGTGREMCSFVSEMCDNWNM